MQVLGCSQTIIPFSKVNTTVVACVRMFFAKPDFVFALSRDNIDYGTVTKKFFDFQELLKCVSSCLACIPGTTFECLLNYQQ